MDRLKSSTATTSSKCLQTFSKRTSAICFLLLQCTGHTGNIVLDKKRVDQGDRYRGTKSACHQGPPVVNVAPDQFGDQTDGHRLFSGAGNKRQGVKIFI